MVSFLGRFAAPVERASEARRRIVASGLGDDTGGGIYVLENGEFSMIDHVSTTGLAVSADATRLARLAWTDDDVDAPGQLMVYDRVGLLAYHRVDDLREAHSAQWDGDVLMVVSTGTNTILWLDRAGRVIRRWEAPGEGDCWHLNSLSTQHGRLLASAFGRFSDHRGWGEAVAREGRGIVVDVRSGRDVMTGLSAPHNPLWLDGGWFVCNSGDGELLRLDASGRVAGRRAFHGWTRGLAYDESFLYLGVSSHRLRGAQGGTAFVVALTRNGLEETERWSLPSREVYDVTLMPEALVEGLRAGAGTPSSIAVGG